MTTNILSPFFKGIFFVMILITAFSSCSKKCKDENPRARINNQGTDKADVQIKTSGGNTENINNIYTGQVSPWVSYAPGQLEFTINVSGSTDTVVLVTMSSCWEYDINIDTADRVYTTPVKRD